MNYVFFYSWSKEGLEEDDTDKVDWAGNDAEGLGDLFLLGDGDLSVLGDGLVEVSAEEVSLQQAPLCPGDHVQREQEPENLIEK